MATRPDRRILCPIKLEWSIKGYHIFRVRPHPDIELKVVPEPTNPYDFNAMKVVLPGLMETPAHLRRDQSVQRNEGRQVGRVPANICRAFKLLLERNIVAKISCRFSGIVAQSSRPSLHQRYTRARHQRQFDRPGGGAELKCVYYFEVDRQKFRECIRILEECVPLPDLNDRLYA